MKTKYEIHPLCAMWPIMAPDQLKELADDIKANGIRQPIVIYEGKVLDGRNRLLAAEMVGFEPTLDNFKAYNGNDPEGVVISANARRRHMPQAARALIVAELRKKQGEKPQSCGSDHITVAKAAALAQVSKRTMEDAVAVTEKAIPAVREAVKSKAVSLEDGASLARKSQSTQRRAAKSGPSGIKAAAAQVAKPAKAASAEPGQAKAAPWTVAMRDEAVRRVQSCYEANRAKWNNPPPPSPRIVVDAMVWALNEGAK